MTQKLLVCSTCKFSATNAFDRDGRTGGELLFNLLVNIQKQKGQNLEIEAYPCLWSCKHSCAIQLQDDTRIGYHAGGFTPDQNAANAILEWAEAHTKTNSGEVPFAEWPTEMRGHFIARIPPIQKDNK